jgi:hypothetical protein
MGFVLIYSTDPTRSLSEIQKGACLTIGALAKTLHEEGREQETTKITKKLEIWLKFHNESTSYFYLIGTR